MPHCSISSETLSDIEEVNEAQKKFEYKITLDRYGTINNLKSILTNAWAVTTLVGALDSESDFKTKRYNPNKESLKGLCSQLGVSTSSYSPSSSSSTGKYTPTTSSSSSQDDFEFSDHAWWILALIGLVIGIAVAGGGGAVFGALMGAGIGSKFSR